MKYVLYLLATIGILFLVSMFKVLLFVIVLLLIVITISNYWSKVVSFINKVKEINNV